MIDRSKYTKRQIEDSRGSRKYWKEYNKRFKRFFDKNNPWNEDWEDVCEYIMDQNEE